MSGVKSWLFSTTYMARAELSSWSLTMMLSPLTLRARSRYRMERSSPISADRLEPCLFQCKEKYEGPQAFFAGSTKHAPLLGPFDLDGARSRRRDRFAGRPFLHW